MWTAHSGPSKGILFTPPFTWQLQLPWSIFDQKFGTFLQIFTILKKVSKEDFNFNSIIIGFVK